MELSEEDLLRHLLQIFFLRTLLILPLVTLAGGASFGWINSRVLALCGAVSYLRLHRRIRSWRSPKVLSHPVAMFGQTRTPGAHTV